MPLDTWSDCIYLNNAATNWPKSPEVLAALQESLTLPYTGGGRRADKEVQDYIWSARTAMADLLGVRNDERVFFSHNAKDALNTLIQGFLTAHPGPAHGITSVLAHNSVLIPLWELQQAGRIDLTLLPLNGQYIGPEAVSESVRPDTSLAVLTHGSNVLGNGGIMPNNGAINH